MDDGSDSDAGSAGPPGAWDVDGEYAEEASEGKGKGKLAASGEEEDQWLEEQGEHGDGGDEVGKGKGTDKGKGKGKGAQRRGGETFVHAQNSPKRQSLPVVDPFRQGQVAKEASAAAGKTSDFSAPVGREAAAATATPRAYSSFQNDKKGKKPDNDFGKWEKHTKGIGMKLLKKMGWKEGQGLGLEGQGITRPVEAVKRARDTQGLQERGERSQQSREDFKSVDSEGEEEERVAAQLQQWKVDHPSVKKRKPKYTFKTADEVAAEAATKAASGAAPAASQYDTVKIIDMTGKTTKVMTGYDSLGKASLKTAAESAIATGVDVSVPMPELQHNLSILVDLAASDIQRINAKLTRERNTKEVLQKDHERLAARLVHETRYIQRLDDIIEALDSLQVQVGDTDLESGKRNNSTLSLESITSLFGELQDKYPQEYRAYNIPALAPTLAFPLVRAALMRWDPLDSPQQHLALFQAWQRLLPASEDDRRTSGRDSPGSPDGRADQNGGHKPPGAFDYLCWEALMPCVRSTLSTGWDPHRPHSAIAFLETWRDVLPDWITDNILEQLLLPKIKDGVEHWRPADPLPMHLWIHPWLPIMQERLEALYPSIRHKLASCLHAWQPADLSAHAVLLPWKDVFRPADMTVFLARSVLPKLTGYVRELVIDPANQSVGPIQSLMAWRDMVAPAEIAKILAEHFFPKFTHVLCSWLSSPSPNFAEIAAWYTGWKSLIGKRVLAVPVVRASLYQALVFMDRAVSDPIAAFDVPQAGLRSAGQAPLRRDRAPQQAMPASGAGAGAPASASVTTSLRDLVQQLADDLGMVYVSTGKSTSDGKPLYAFGKATIYMDRDVIFARKKDGKYQPTSLSDLTTLAR
jgi:tuftelin-interacting protein 11